MIARMATDSVAGVVPEPVRERLPGYLRAVERLLEQGCTAAACEELAGTCLVSAAALRRDLAHVHALGQRGVSYSLRGLRTTLRSALHLDRVHRAVVIGVGRMGTALAHYPGLKAGDFDLVALIDCDSAKIGTSVSGITVHAPGELPALTAQLGLDLALVAVPAHAAVGVIERCADAGLSGVLNFAPVKVASTSLMSVRNVDLMGELQLLCHQSSRARRADSTGTRPTGTPPAPTDATARGNSSLRPKETSPKPHAASRTPLSRPSAQMSRP